DAPGMWHSLGLERLHSGEGGEGRVPVVGGAATVEPVTATDGRPRPEPLAPADHLGLLVEVAVEEDRLVRAPGNLHQKERRPAGQADALDLQPLPRALPRPAGRELDGSVQMAVRLPFAVEAGRLRRDADVLLERGDDPRRPGVLDERAEAV